MKRSILAMLATALLLSSCGGDEIERLREANALLAHDVKRLRADGAKLRDRLQQAQDAIEDAQDGIDDARDKLAAGAGHTVAAKAADDDLADASDALDDALDATADDASGAEPLMTRSRHLASPPRMRNVAKARARTPDARRQL